MDKNCGTCANGTVRLGEHWQPSKLVDCAASLPDCFISVKEIERYPMMPDEGAECPCYKPKELK